MVRTTMKPGALVGATGARVSSTATAGRLDSSLNRRALKLGAHVDELLVRLGDRHRLGRITDWEQDFARSVLGQAKRAGPRWSPSAKQIATIRRIVEQPADDADDTPLIEPIEGGGR